MANSKYFEICEIIKNTQNDNSNYKEESTKFIEKLCDILKTDWGIPDTNFSVCPIKREGHKIIFDEIEMFMSSDTFWHYGVKITFYEKNIEMKLTDILFHFRFKKIKNKYIAKISDEDKGFEIEFGDEESYHEYIKYLFNSISSILKNSLDDFLQNKTNEIQIGFHPNSESSPQSDRLC